MKKTLVLGLIAGFSMTALAVNAQSFNDNGTPATATPLNLVGPYTPSGSGAICPSGPVVSAFTGATTQMGRIFRDGVASVCPVKPYPGIFNAATVYNYETYTYSNTSAAPACVTVNFDPDTAGASPCTTNAHMSAYVGSYDPMNQATNFLGDVGSSLAQPFSFEIAASSQLVLVVSNTSSQAVCTFGFEVLNLPCTVATAADLSVTVAAAPPSATPGAPVDFTVTSTNGGPDPAQDVVVSLDLGTGFTFNSVNAPGAVCTDPGVGVAGIVSCTFAGATASGGQQAIVVNATAPGVGVATVIGSTTSATTDPTPGNNTATTAYTINGAAPTAVDLPIRNTLSLLLLGLMLVGLGWVAVRRRTQ